MPEGVLYCKIVGRLRAFGEVTDEAGIPVFTAVKGGGIITCSARTLTLAEEPETVFPNRIVFTIDADGYISKGGVPFLMIPAPSPALSPPVFDYRVLLDFDDGKLFGPYRFDADPGGVVDITDVITAGAPSA